MNTATISTKFQVMIPKGVRDFMKIEPGMKFEVIPYGNRIEMVKVRPMKEFRGISKGMDTTIIREKDRI